MNIRWNIILGTITFIIFAWLYTQEQRPNSLINLVKSDETPEYSGQKMKTTLYSVTGEKQYIALADNVEYFDNDGHTDFNNPIVFVLDAKTILDKSSNTSEQSKKNDAKGPSETQKESWKLSADKATLTKDNFLHLKGNVLVQSLMADSRLQRIETETAVVDLKTQDITSDQMVKINGLNFTTTGLKLTGNLKQQAATLKEQVKTHYEINNK